MLICIVMDKHGSSWSTVRERVGHSPASLTFCLLQQPVSISLSCILTVWSCCHVTIIQQTWNTRCVVWHFWICCLPLFPCFTPGAENDLRGQTCTTDTAPWTSKTGAAVLVTVCLCFCCNSARAHIHTHTHTRIKACVSLRARLLAFQRKASETAQNIKIYRPLSCFVCLLSHSLRWMGAWVTDREPFISPSECK